MTSATSDFSNSVKPPYYLNTNQKPFPNIRDGKIDTLQFLEAAEGVVTLVDKLGKLFTPLKYDMRGNFEKIRECYRSDVAKNVTLHDMLLSDNVEVENLCRVGLLWFSRALHFIEEFLEQILSTTHENIQGELKRAYNSTLRPYHGRYTRAAFTYIYKQCPRRSSLVKSLERQPGQDSSLQDMRTFLQSLRVNRKEIYRIFADHKLKNDRIIY